MEFEFKRLRNFMNGRANSSQIKTPGIGNGVQHRENLRKPLSLNYRSEVLRTIQEESGL